jgi:GrpB-like predicted nucleotidyltransferase (UPF0157 family)
MTTAITIQDYDPRWPAQFAALRAQLATVLNELADAIEHIGSTAVPGLAAKPIVDIDVLLKPTAALPLVIARLAPLGYEHQGDLGVADREAFGTPKSEIAHHLYICPHSSVEYARHIIFRDHLRSHIEDANNYATLKRQLAARFATDREAYTQAKSEFVEKILRSYRQNLGLSKK